MRKIIDFIESYAPSLLRYGMAAVILWFSFAQFSNVKEWIAYIPDSIVAMTNINAIALVYMNATFELIFGVLLVFGWQTRIVALLLAAHLFDIMYVVGYGEIGVRDFGLAVGTLVVCMNGADALCIQQKKKTSPVIAQVPIQPLPQAKRLI
ncbi:MAG: DoxX family protein [Candidatus Pacebacteria bacterium]|nr:DoxX family protein [Candidatus Paceibacterota bacterium]